MGWQIVAAVIQSIGLGIVLPVALAWIGAHVRNTALRNALDMGLKRAGGIAYDYLSSRASGLSASSARMAAINAGIDYVAAALPDTVRSAGVTPDVLRNMVTGELGKLLAVDPGVTVASSPPPLPKGPTP